MTSAESMTKSPEANGDFRDRHVRGADGNVVYTVRLYRHPGDVGHVIVMTASGSTIEDSGALPFGDARYLGNMWFDLYKMEA